MLITRVLKRSLKIFLCVCHGCLKSQSRGRPDLTSRIVALVLGTFLLSSCSGCRTSNSSTGSASSGEERRVTLLDGSVSFIPPANLKQLTQEQIAASRFGGDKPATYVFANESLTVTVGVVPNFVELQPDQLEDFIDANRRLLTMGVADVQFLKEEIVTINGRQWVHFEIQSEAPAANLHNHQFTTSFKNGALVFGFNSTMKEYPQYKDAFLQSAQTIIIKE